MKKTIAIIDDDGIVRKHLGKGIEELTGIAPVAFAYIPDDLTKLDPYDVLVVDNQGIGNATYKDGVAFLKVYAKLRPGKTFVHYSGYVNSEDRKALEALGVFIKEKNCSAYKTALSISPLVTGETAVSPVT